MRESSCRQRGQNCVCLSWDSPFGGQDRATCPVPTLDELQAPINERCRDTGCLEFAAAKSRPDWRPGSELTSSQRACLYTALSVALTPGRLRPSKSGLRADRPNACMLLFAPFIHRGYGNGAEIVGEYTEYRWAEGANIPGNRCDVPGIAAWAYAPGSHEPLVMLCREFCDLTVPLRAMVLIHEGLHTAGLSENPPNPKAPTSRDINEVVQHRCHL